MSSGVPTIDSTPYITPPPSPRAPNPEAQGAMANEVKKIPELLILCRLQQGLENFLPSLMVRKDLNLILDVIRNAFKSLDKIECTFQSNVFLSSSKVVMTSNTALDQIFEDLEEVCSQANKDELPAFLNDIFRMVRGLENEGAKCYYIRKLIRLGLVNEELVECIKGFKNQKHQLALISALTGEDLVEIPTEQALVLLESFTEVVSRFKDENESFEGYICLARGYTLVNMTKAKWSLTQALAMASVGQDPLKRISAGFTQIFHSSMEEEGFQPVLIDFQPILDQIIQIKDPNTKLKGLETFFLFLCDYTGSVDSEKITGFIENGRSAFLEFESDTHLDDPKCQMLRAMVQLSLRLPKSSISNQLFQILFLVSSSSDSLSKARMQVQVDLAAAFFSIEEKQTAFTLLEGVMQNASNGLGDSSELAVGVIKMCKGLAAADAKVVLQSVERQLSARKEDGEYKEDLDEAMISLANGYFAVKEIDKARKIISDLIKDLQEKRKRKHLDFHMVKRVIEPLVPAGSRSSLEFLLTFCKQMTLLKLLEKYPDTFWGNHKFIHTSYELLLKEIKILSPEQASLAQLIFLLNASKNLS